MSGDDALAADQGAIDEANSAFWNDICGSQLAMVLGITDDSPTSLKKFDDWYFEFYPYLLQHAPVHRFAGKRVLEIGLGYGSLSQKIAEAGADYVGMDIAAGPVNMVNTRLRQQFLAGEAIHRSFLKNELPSGTFDAVVAIGCFHHTGDVQKCFDETWRILKPGGHAYLMVYNRYSHRRWMQNRPDFLKELLAERLGLLKTARASRKERAANDRSLDGEAAPETVFLSVGEVRRRMRRFSSVSVVKENMDESDDPKWNRNTVLPTWGRRMGLDLYIAAVK